MPFFTLLTIVSMFYYRLVNLHIRLGKHKQFRNSFKLIVAKHSFKKGLDVEIQEQYKVHDFSFRLTYLFSIIPT